MTSVARRRDVALHLVVPESFLKKISVSPFSVIFLLFTFLVHRYFSLLSMWLIVTLDWLCFSAPEIITLIRARCRSELVAFENQVPVYPSCPWLLCVAEPVEARKPYVLVSSWHPKAGSGLSCLYDGPWCPRVQIDTSQGNSKPWNRCECVWRLTLHKITTLSSALSFNDQGWPRVTFIFITDVSRNKAQRGGI